MRVPFWTIPVLIVVISLAGLGFSYMISFPSITVTFYGDDQTIPETKKIINLIIDGVTCVDTALKASSTVEDVDGVLKFTAYASHRRVEIEYDPSRTTPEKICNAIEGPVFDQDSGEILFNVFRVLRINETPYHNMNGVTFTRNN
ncbi:cation transporter [bacterium]|nr:cation transporter [candidate division CSSED10-310 bacterium]